MNIQSFKLFISKQKIFAFKIYGFPQIQAWRFVTRNTVRMVARIITQLRLARNVSAKAVRVSISKFAMSLKLTKTVSCRRVSITTVFRMTKKMVANNYIRLSVTPIFRERARSSSSILGGKVSLAGSPLVGTFKNLVLYDSQTLANLDSLTLSDMDYILSN